MCIWLAPETTDEVTTAEQWAIANGIVKGNGADYGWTDTPTKSQVALMMYRHDNPAPVTPTAPASTATSTTAQPKTLKGIDVSENQGVIDWDKVKPNISFAMIRAGFGHNNIDKQFVRNASECTRLGIPFGVYWFSYATNADMAAQEAAYCLAAIKPYHLNMPIVFDFEYDSVNYAKKMDVTITKALATSFVTAFCSAIEKAGYWATMYSNLDYLTNYFDASLLQKYDLWFANPVSNPDFTSPPHTCGMWQYSFTGTMDGITGNVDLDIAYQQYLSLIK
jgi:GH25 family lysozyme M1 (1,4-beta-N-acetylmuramidase)